MIITKGVLECRSAHGLDVHSASQSEKSRWPNFENINIFKRPSFGCAGEVASNDEEMCVDLLVEKKKIIEKSVYVLNTIKRSTSNIK